MKQRKSITIILKIQLPQVEYLIDIQILSSFCVDRKKKQERTANTLPLSFDQPTPRHLSWQTCESVLIMTSSFRIGLNLRNLNKTYCQYQIQPFPDQVHSYHSDIPAIPAPFSDTFLPDFLFLSEIKRVVLSFSCIFSENSLQRVKTVIILHRKKKQTPGFRKRQPTGIKKQKTTK